MHVQLSSECDLTKIFFTSKFSYLLFCNPTHKTETRFNVFRGGLLVANHLNLSVWWANKKHSKKQSDQIYYTLFCSLLPATDMSWTNPACLTFLHPILLCRSHTEHRWRWFKRNVRQKFLLQRRLGSILCFDGVKN